MTEQRSEDVAKEIADRDKARRPHTRSNEIQYHESLPMYCAHPHRKRREIAHPIDETKRQNETGVVALEPIQADSTPYRHRGNRFNRRNPKQRPIQK